MPRQHTTNDLTYRRNRQTLLADNPPCYRCGKPADTADHIIEVFQGGGNDWTTYDQHAENATAPQAP
jgi:5-methylcytosine-specific restriction endonuclease McrA